jgi:hypothetical protein
MVLAFCFPVHSEEKVASLPHPTLLFSVSFECSVSCMLDVSKTSIGSRLVKFPSVRNENRCLF